jgi:hypothetical protein
MAAKVLLPKITASYQCDMNLVLICVAGLRKNAESISDDSNYMGSAVDRGKFIDR